MIHTIAPMAYQIVRIILTLICLGLVVVIHEYGHFLVARYLGVRVERFTVGFGPEIVGWTRGDTRYAICAVPLGGMVKLAGEFMDERSQKPDEFFSQVWYRRAAIALAGPVMNYALAFVIFALVAGAWGILEPSSQPIVGAMIPGLPAADAHFQEGDRVLRISGQAVHSWDEMAGIIHNHPNEQLSFDIERTATAGAPARPLSVSLVTQRDAQRGVGLIGIMPHMDQIHPGVRGSVVAAGRDLKTWTLQPLGYLAQKIRRWEGPKELSGPIGIAQMVSKATHEGFAYVLYLIAVISTGLGLFNLFPIPVLDGGHIFLYVIEGVLRRPLSRRVMQVANTVGLSLIVTIFLYASYQDVLRWRVGFWK